MIECSDPRYQPVYERELRQRLALGESAQDAHRFVALIMIDDRTIRVPNRLHGAAINKDGDAV